MNRNQTETKVRRFKSRYSDCYLEFVGEVGTFTGEDGTQVNSDWKLIEAECDSMWVEIVESPSLPATPSESKPMTIREAAKALKEEFGVSFLDEVNVSLEFHDDGWRLKCRAYFKSSSFSGPNFENVLAQIRAKETATNSESSDRIIDL